MSIDEATRITIYLPLAQLFTVTLYLSRENEPILEKRKVHVFIPSGAKIMSTKIIYTNKNYVELRKRKNFPNFAYEMVFARVRLTKPHLHQYGSYFLYMFDVTIFSYSFSPLTRLYCGIVHIYSFEFEIGFEYEFWVRKQKKKTNSTDKRYSKEKYSQAIFTFSALKLYLSYVCTAIFRIEFIWLSVSIWQINRNFLIPNRVRRITRKRRKPSINEILMIKNFAYS